VSVAIVTGAAGGIGSAVCAALAEAGAEVAALDRPGIEPPVGTSFPVDVADPDSVEAAVAEVGRELGPADTLVTAAGWLEEVELEEISDASWGSMLAVHLDGTFLLCRAVAPGMAERGRGAIVTISSELALTGAERHAHYCAAKAAIIGFTKSIALELAPRGVRANVVAPGPTDTPMLTDEWRAPDYLATLPVGRIAQPHEIAAAVRFLVSDDAAWFVGEVLSPNCGAVI
jgi:2-hydroxycyclohexanecarboxyl-CoA dehydrogenase